MDRNDLNYVAQLDLGKLPELPPTLNFMSESVTSIFADHGDQPVPSSPSPFMDDSAFTNRDVDLNTVFNSSDDIAIPTITDNYYKFDGFKYYNGTEFVDITYPCTARDLVHEYLFLGKAIHLQIKSIYIPTESYKATLRDGRKIWRHSNNEGTVLEFDQYGTLTKLYVPDAEYRLEMSYYKELSSSDTSNIQYYTGNFKYTTDYTRILDFGKSPVLSFTSSENLTDTQLQIRLDSVLEGQSFKNDFTAKEGTNAILEFLDSNSQAATYVRSIVPTGLRSCDLPNVYELSIIWLESDNIDLIDPTVNIYEDSRLGSPTRFCSPNAGRLTSFWSCTEVPVSDTIRFCNLIIDDTGGISYHQRKNGVHVVPVLEL